MPIYEYICTVCQHELEKLQKVNDEPLRYCPACDEESLRKKISAAGFRLKGGGWYETDFKTGKRKNIAGDSDKSGSSASGADTTSGGDKSSAKSTGDKKPTESS